MKDIQGTTAVCGVIGNPIAHTLSPLIHNTLASLTGTELAYVPFPVENERVGEAVKGAFALGIKGLNVTVPHKSAVIPYLAEIDETAAKIGAVNTLVRTADGYKGYNTDMPGLLKALRTEHVEVTDAEVILLGAGGVGRAVAMMCAVNGAKEIYLLNRTLEKARQVADEVKEASGRDCVRAMALVDYGVLAKKKYLVIQCTSVGMHPNTEDVLIADEAFYEYVGVGVDLIFNPAQTSFMKLAKKAGARTMNGLKMLLYQGIIAYELWNGVQVTQEQADEVYGRMRSAMGISEEI